MKRSFLLYIALLPVLVFAFAASPDKPADIEGMRVVQVLGLDKADGGFRLSVCTAGDEPQRLSGEGKSISEAMETLENASAGGILYDHVSSVFLGESLCREDMDRCLDWFCTSDTVRMDIPLYIIRSAPASEAIDAGSASAGSGKLAEGIRERTEERGGTVMTVSALKGALLSRGSALVCALECVKADGGDGAVLIPSGFGMIRAGLLSGFIDEQDGAAAALLMGETPRFDLELEDKNGVAATLALRGRKCGVVPVWAEDGTLSALEIDLTAEAGVIEGDAGDFFGGKAELKRLAEQRLSVCAGRVLRRCRAMGTDFAGLGQRAERASPMKYRNMGTDFDSVLGRCEIRLTVSVRI